MINIKNKIKNYKRGMSYVELIVVLSIFATMSSVVLFNYDVFQARVDIKNLASDIALKIVEAQKASLSGKIPPVAQQANGGTNSTWKSSYGVYFNLASNSYVDNKSFIYFVDLSNTTPAQNNAFDGGASGCTGECLEKVSITRGDYVSSMDVYYKGNPIPANIHDLTLTFQRSDSSVSIGSSGIVSGTIDYVQLTISSPKNITGIIKVYPSGRIQIN